MADNNDKKYQGPDAVTTAIGQSNIDSAYGFLAGGAIGAAAGALMHNKEAQAAAKAAEKLTLKGVWSQMGRGYKALWGALIVGAVVSSVTEVTGFFRGKKKAEEARNQFDQLNTENAVLKEKLASAEASLEQSKSFVAHLKAEREKPKVQEAAR